MKKIILSILLVLCLVGAAWSADWHVGVTAFGGYDKASWGSGMDPAPEGTIHQDDWFWMVAGQVRSDIIKLPWELQPTIELSYQQRRYDFSSPQTPIQKTSPRGYSALLGVTKEWKWLNGYLLGGVTYWDINLKMVEANGTVHGGTPTGIYGIIGGGLYKPFKLWKKLTLSPEIKIYAYPVRPGMRRCRDFLMGYVNPFLGARMEW